MAEPLTLDRLTALDDGEITAVAADFETRPPQDLLRLAIEAGCSFAIDSDAHTPGQLAWQDYGCEHAAEALLEPERVINTMDADDLLAWAKQRGP